MASVIDAWADMKGWVEQTLPGLALSQSLPNITQDLGDIGACDGLNQFSSGSTSIWGSAGGATITITSLQISVMSGVQIQDATGQSPNFQLPFQFGSLQVEGSYGYSQPCSCYDAGHEVSSTSETGNGTISWSISGGTITYAATLTDQLAITGVTVGGGTSVSVNPDTGGMPSWLVAIGNFFSSFNEQQALTGSVGNVFQTASFTNTMLSLLNAKLGGGS
jgi:hypothetical protein